jgi:TfoX/Sxy family transcriptional regulator of competence genes
VSHPAVPPEARYASIVQALRSHPNITHTHAADTTSSQGMFGSRGQLKVDGKIFAMLAKDTLVVKLPQRRVAQEAMGFVAAQSPSVSR